MKIGIDGRELVKDKITGIGRVLLNFLNDVLRRKEDWQFVIFLNQYSRLDRDETNLKKIIIPENSTLWWDQVKLCLWLKKENIDLFFSPYYKAPLFTHSKTIISLFDITYLLFPPYKERLANRLYIRNFLRLSVIKASRIVTSSRYSLTELVSKLSLPEKKISLVPLSAGDRFKPISDDILLNRIKEKYGIKGKYILYVGNFNPHKNIKRLVDAYNLLPIALKQEYGLVLGGGEPERISKNDYLSGHNNRQFILYVGNISDGDLPALYSSAELFVFPSLYEGFGLPPLEAMGCGCPVVSSNASSMPEVLGDAVLFFNPYDAEEMSRIIKQMLEDENLRNQFRQKGLARAKLFTPEKMTDRIINVFESEFS